MHPTDLPALPPPDWVKDEAVRDSRGRLVASGKSEDAGNDPRKALAAAKQAAAAKLAQWLAKRKIAAPPQEARRIARTHIGPDGRAYVQLELELPEAR